MGQGCNWLVSMIIIFLAVLKEVEAQFAKLVDKSRCNFCIGDDRFYQPRSKTNPARELMELMELS